ncbi:MAG: 4Fe-4S dicluster domain-containing protein [Syntrophaceae bacterium]|nr:4Fe-4S dicluster domain-containing protein [Syntrophaceae bacterium]
MKKKRKMVMQISRRDFLKYTGTVAIGAGAFPNRIWLDDAIAAIPASEGYLLVDTKKCQGCLSCMLACSLVHEGEENLSLARIQVLQNSFAKFPDDLTMAQCRQCVEPACVEACPVKALFVDKKNGNVRVVDVKKCIGCKSCVQACPFEPSRALWNPNKKKALKCDLCSDAPFWSKKGGVEGKQACVEVCPLSAIKFTKEIPEQKGDTGYKVNLREESWRRLGYSAD